MERDLRGCVRLLVGNGRPTEAMNNLIKRIKRVPSGSRTSGLPGALLYAGRPDWGVTREVTPR